MFKRVNCGEILRGLCADVMGKMRRCGCVITLSSSSSVSRKRPPRANFQQSIAIQIEKSFILCIKIHIYTFLFLINRYIGLYVRK